MSTALLARLLERLSAIQARRPALVILLVLATLVPTGWAASTLTLKTSFTELLPDDKPSVIEMRRTQERLASTSTLTVVALGNDVVSLKRFVDEVAPKLRTLPKELVVDVDDGTHAARTFFQKHKHLYADLADIRQAHDEVVERYDYEVGKRSGMDLGLDEDEAAPPKLDVDAIEKRFQKKADAAKDVEPGIDGYYIGGKERTVAAIILNTPLDSGSKGALALEKRVRELVESVHPRRYDPKVEVGYTGSLLTSAEQQRAITRDLAEVGAWGIAMVLGVVFLFFLRIRTLFCMGVTIAVGCVWSFALAAWAVGYLNAATGFLASIIAGNGINFGIIYMARYMEARRDQQLDAGAALSTAHADTYAGTLGAAAAAMISYGSLAVTDFRGFKHFGIICGGGMVLCWIATYVFLPAVLAQSERIAPMFVNEKPWMQRLRGLYGYPFAWVARRWPRAITLFGAATGIAATVLTVRYFTADPTEYNYRNIRNDRVVATDATRLSGLVDDVVGRLKHDGKAILTDRLDQIKPLVTELARRRDATEKGKEPFDKIVSVYDLLPEQQDEKVVLLTTLKDRLERGKKRGFITEAEWERLRPYVPEQLAPIGIEDLPSQVARPFTEKDGTRGRIVYLVPAKGKSVYDMKYVMQWADSFREVNLPSGEIIRGTGTPVIYSDMLLNVAEDAPKAIFLSVTGVLCVMFLSFRQNGARLAALAALLLGFVYLIAFLSLRDIKINFLNFVALPVSVGVGADYALNVLQRRQLEGDDRLYRVLVETGGAVVLCSCTTILGYLALLTSINGAVRTFGLAAAMGELFTIAASMIVLPGALFWAAERRRARSAPAAAPPGGG